MTDYTRLVLLITTIGVLYKWRPVLGGPCLRLIGWSLLLSVLSVTSHSIIGVLSMGLPGSALYQAAASKGHSRVYELLNDQRVPSHVNDGMSFEPLGMIFFRPSLHVAATEGHDKVVNVLLKAGADPDMPWTFGLFGVLGSDTPLHDAAHRGHVDVVASLLRAGASPNTPSTYGPFGLLGWNTPLHAAAVEGHEEVVASLIKAGADPNAVGTLGPFGLLASGTPLYVAAANGHTKVVAALLKAGANPKRASYLGPLYARTPMEVAASHDHAGTVEVLRSAIDAK